MPTAPVDPADRRSLLLAWLQLLRVPALPSAASNVLAGYLLVAGQWEPAQMVMLVVASSLLFCCGGMIGNDLADEGRDRQKKASRPLPSGRLSRWAAATAMVLLFLGGLACAFATLVKVHSPSLAIRTALVLLVAIIAYDFVFKRWLVSAFFMGLCRGINLLLGAAAAISSEQGSPAEDNFSAPVWVASGALALYVTGLTWLARDEDESKPRRWLLWLGVATMAAGLALNAWLPWCPDETGLPPLGQVSRTHVILIAVIGFTVLRRGVVAAITGDRLAIRKAVVLGLASMITLDAATALFATGGNPVYSLWILGLLGLNLFLARLVSPT